MAADPGQDRALRSRRVVTASGVHDAVVSIRGGVIAAVEPPSQRKRDLPVQDLGDLVLMAGIVDSHVHINEPGRTDWEGFRTATRAAAAGGITALADMPLNSDPVTTTGSALRQKMECAAGETFVDVGFYGGVVPGSESELAELHRAGVLGFKAFLCPSGIEDFPAIDAGDLRRVMPRLAAWKIPLLVHAELLPDGHAVDESEDFATYLASRPDRYEVEAIELLIELSRQTGCWVHVVHLSTANALGPIEDARSHGIRLSVETCPHYLWFEAESIESHETLLKCAPPIRSGANRRKLWSGLRAGLIDFVVSDHSPCLPLLKEPLSQRFSDAWGGINSLGLTLPVVWTAASKRGVSLVELSRWLSSGPAALLGLERSKGTVAAGYDADLVAWDPEAEFRVGDEVLHQRHKTTPYAGRELRGAVRYTFLRGQEVYRNGEFGANASGRLLVARGIPNGR